MTADPNPYAPSAEYAPPRKSRLPAILLCGTAALLVLLLLVVTAVAAYALGAVHATTELYHRRASHEVRQIQSYLQEHPDRYFQVTIQEISSGHSYLYGTVNSQEHLDVLKTEMQRLFGAELGEEMTNGVEVAPSD